MNENKLAEENIRIEARQRGVSEDRIIFATRMDPPQHLARIRLADLFLDTFIYNAGATAAGALFAGLPLLTKYGTTVLSRMGSSMTHAAGLDDLICQTQEEYESKAIELGLDPEKLRAIKEKLAVNLKTCALFDTQSWVQNLEKGFEQMWVNAQENEHKPIRL